MPLDKAIASAEVQKQSYCTRLHSFVLATEKMNLSWERSCFVGKQVSGLIFRQILDCSDTHT